MSRDDDRRGGRDDRGRDDRGSRDRDDRGSRDRSDSRDSRGSRDDRGGRDDRGRDDRGSRDNGRDDRGSSGSSSRFSYRERSAEDTRERMEKGAVDYDKLLKPGVKMYKVADGENRPRILPPTWEGARHYGVDVHVHYGVGSDRGSYICPQKHGGLPCPICEERDEARRDNNPDEDYLKQLEAKRRVLIYLVDRNDEKEGVQAWLMPWTLDKDITKISVDKDNGGAVLPIDHPEDGYDVIFDKTGKGDRTKYEGVQIARRSSPLGKAAWLDYAMDNPLPDQLQVHDYDVIAKTFGAKGVQRDTRGGSGGRGGDDRGRDDRRDDRGADRDRGSDRGGDSGRDDRGRDRGDDRGRGREPAARERDDEPTWESVHKMTWTEMEDLVELKDLPIKPKEAKDEDDLADWICDELKLKKNEAPPARERRSSSSDDRGSDAGSDRLREMRRNRAD